MKILILDDESAGRRELRRLLEPYEDIEIIGEAATVQAALDLANKHHPEIAFVDVRLKGETGFDFVGRLEGVQPRLVFVTAYDSFAVRGFECNAIDYLMKPVLPERLEEALDRSRRQEQLERKAASEEDSVFLRFERTARLVPWKEISHIRADGNYTRVETSEGPAALVLRPLKEWLDLAPPGMFVQVHRGFLIRISAIEAITAVSQKQHELTLCDGHRVTVTRSYWTGLKSAILRWHPEASGCFT